MENLFQEINNKPMRLCKNCGKCYGNFPKSFWDELPSGCGFEGWFFQKREEIKQKIRKQKEELLNCQIALSETHEFLTDEILEKIDNIKKEISVYKNYGSVNW